MIQNSFCYISRILLVVSYPPFLIGFPQPSQGCFWPNNSRWRNTAEHQIASTLYYLTQACIAKRESKYMLGNLLLNKTSKDLCSRGLCSQNRQPMMRHAEDARDPSPRGPARSPVFSQSNKASDEKRRRVSEVRGGPPLGDPYDHTCFHSVQGPPTQSAAE